ncbi:MAG: GTP pyrophosphokinase [Thiotrichales bacterium]|nr:GTP pyrophosphokinase [Thiotrichales bacterium]
MNKIAQIKQLVSEINRLHLTFSNDYFETGKIDKINLSRTVKQVPVPHIYTYRLTLHECINDYLMNADIELKYFYRVKTRESIDDKITRFSAREDQYPVNNWLHDVFGVRIILTADEINTCMDLLDDWQDELNLKNWYLRDKVGYRGLHVYFKNKNNFYFPWELQIWDAQDIQSNIANHEKFKRHFASSTHQNQ